MEEWKRGERGVEEEKKELGSERLGNVDRKGGWIQSRRKMKKKGIIKNLIEKIYSEIWE